MFGRSVFVTGCDSGIGFALLERLPKLGFYTICTCTSVNSLNIINTLFKSLELNLTNTPSNSVLSRPSSSTNTASTATNIGNLEDSRIDYDIIKTKVGFAVILDVLNRNKVRDISLYIARLIKAGAIPKLYAVINNAATWRFSSLQESCLSIEGIDKEVDQWDEVIKTNLLGYVYVTLYLLPLLATTTNPSGRNRIILISSALDSMGIPGQPSYITSKFGVRGLHESLLHELDNVHSILISPGALRDTNLFNHSLDLKDSFKLKYTRRLKYTLGKLRELGASKSTVVNTVIKALMAKRPKKHYLTNGHIYTLCKLLPRTLFIKLFKILTLYKFNIAIVNKTIKFLVQYQRALDN